MWVGTGGVRGPVRGLFLVVSDGVLQTIAPVAGAPRRVGDSDDLEPFTTPTVNQDVGKASEQEPTGPVEIWRADVRKPHSQLNKREKPLEEPVC